MRATCAFGHSVVCSVLIVSLSPISLASVNMWVSESETKALLGLRSEIFYIQEGIVNQYAMNFSITIPANISQLHFNWQSTSRKPVRYKLSSELTGAAVVRAVTFNVPASGSVPQDPGQLVVTAPCRPRVSGTAQLVITVTFQLPRDQHHRLPKSRATLRFRRRRVCRDEDAATTPALVDGGEKSRHHAVQRDSPHMVSSPPSPQQPSPAQRSPPQRSHDQRISASDASTGGVADGAGGVASRDAATGAFYIAVGCSCGVLLVIVLVLAVVVTRHRAAVLRKRSHSASCEVYSSPMQHQPQHLQHHQQQCSSMTFASLYSCQSLHSLHQYASLRPRVTLPSSSSQSTVTTPLSLAPCQAGTVEPVHSHNHQQQQMCELMVDRRRVQLERCVARAGEACVWSGWVTTDQPFSDKERVLVKSLTERAGSGQISGLLQDGLVYYGLRHKNLLTPLAVAVEECRSPLILYPYMKHFNLKQYLQSCAYGSRSGCCNQVTACDIIEMAEQVCQALSYLHQQGIFHGDVAARNCCLDESLHVKLTDNALSRDLFSEDYSQVKGHTLDRPAKWLPPEVLVGHVYSDMTDVWSFGVLLWEMTTLAVVEPYAGISVDQLDETLRQGYRLNQPLNCTTAMYSLMSFCWNYEPARRPSVDRVLDYLRRLLKQTRLTHNNTTPPLSTVLPAAAVDS